MPRSAVVSPFPDSLPFNTKSNAHRDNPRSESGLLDPAWSKTDIDATKAKLVATISILKGLAKKKKEYHTSQLVLQREVIS
jgi:hypothetical protein